MMQNFRIIPSLMFENERLVKGKQFNNHIDSGDPIKTCVAYDSQYADEICLIDLGAYKYKTKPNFELLKKIVSECNTPITFGGNVSSVDDAKNIINSGADKILINSNLSRRLTDEISSKFGAQSIVGGIDIYKENENYKVFQQKKILNIDPIKKIEEILKFNLGEIKITFVNNEGSKKGFDNKFSKKIINISDKPIIFEGGFSNLEDINLAFKEGIDSIALGTMVTFSDNNIFKIKQFLENKGHDMRLRN